jgi:probable HAF family extracellular repeat protein
MSTSMRTPLVTLTLVVAALLIAPGVVAAGDGGRGPGVEPRSYAPVFVMDGKRFTFFDPPGPTPAGYPGPVAQDIVEINNRGQVVGGYKENLSDPRPEAAGAGFRGFLRDFRGRFELIDVPRAAGTTPFDISDRGDIVGTYSRTDSNTGLAQDKRGFLRDARGRYTTIRVPGSLQTQAFGVNNRGQVVGEYLDRQGFYHGYRWQNGRFTTLDGPEGTGAAALDVNDRGQVVGAYMPGGTDELRGFLLEKRRYTTFDAPGGRYDTWFGLNDRGEIVVSTTNGSLASVRAYVLREGVDGPFTEIKVRGQLTLATGIDDHGRIVGLFQNPNATASAQRSQVTALPLLDALPLGLAERRETR